MGEKELLRISWELEGLAGLIMRATPSPKTTAIGDTAKNMIRARLVDFALQLRALRSAMRVNPPQASPAKRSDRSRRRRS